MSDSIIYPRIIWKVDLSFLNADTRSYCQSVHILKSYWRLIIELDAEWDEYKIYLIPENPEIYVNVTFFIECSVRDIYGRHRFEILNKTSAENLLSCYMWGASRRLLLDENLIQNNSLCIVCTVEPESNWEGCQVPTHSTIAARPCTSIPCRDELISDFKYLYKYSLHHDVILECENEIIKAHKCVLSCRSRVFEGMFRSGLKEALEGKVVIRDTPLNIFKQLIHYIYTTEINFEDINFASKMYSEADKYFIVCLKERCKQYFKAYLCAPYLKDELGSRVSEACKILRLADKHADIPLQCWVEDYLADSFLLSTQEWKTFAEENTDLAIAVYFKLLKNVKLGKSSFY